MAQSYPLPRQTRQNDILVGDGVNRVYGPFNFKISDVDDVTTWIKRPSDVDWRKASVVVEKVAGLPFDNFTVKFAAVITPADQFVVSGARLHERTAPASVGTRLSMDALKKELSKQGAILQELARDAAKALKTPFDTDPQFLPSPTTDRMLGCHNDGKLRNIDPGRFVNIAGAATAAQGITADSQPDYFDNTLGLSQSRRMINNMLAGAVYDTSVGNFNGDAANFLVVQYVKHTTPIAGVGRARAALVQPLVLSPAVRSDIARDLAKLRRALEPLEEAKFAIARDLSDGAPEVLEDKLVEYGEAMSRLHDSQLDELDLATFSWANLNLEANPLSGTVLEGLLPIIVKDAA